MTTNNSHNNARKVVLITLSSIVILPITFFITYLLLNRPTTKIKTPQNTSNSNTTNLNTSNDKLASTINDNISFQFTRPNDKWQHKILQNEVNQYDKLNSYQIEISNETSKINLTIVENDIRYKKGFILGPNYEPNPINKTLIKSIPSDKKGKSIVYGNSNMLRVNNPKANSGQIIIDINMSENKEYSTNLYIFDNYTQHYRNQELYTQITYNQDSDENYLVMDSIITSFKFKINP